jgi:hypothetical protein
MSNLEIVGLKNNIKYDFTVNDIKNKIVNRINELGLNNIKYKHDNEFLVLICNLIEFLVNKKDKITKSDLAFSIYCEIFDIDKTSEDEKLMLKHNINFIYDNGSIKKISKWKLFKCGLKEIFKKK